MMTWKQFASRWVPACAVTLGMLSGGAAQAAVPQASVVEATLNSTGGGPAADGTYAITFAIYKDATDPTALWSEGPVQVAVKNGQFSYVLGSTVPVKPSLLAGGAFLTFKIGTDPELPRKAVNASLFALRAAVAEGIDCSGCIPASALDQQGLAPYAKKSDLAGVALSGNYSDLSGLPTLTAYAKAADLAKAATTGSFSDLKDVPVMAQVGKSCGTGLVLAGFKADGALDCVAGGAASVPADGIDEISNNLIFNQFTDVISSPKQPIDIPDNNPIGASDEIIVPDLGVAQKLSVSLTLVNSDISKVKVFLYDPSNTEYVLYDKSGKAGDGIITTYPDNTKPVSGDLTAWVGKNPKGKWILKVVDSGFYNNASDGQVQKWSVVVQTLSNKKIQIKGDLIVDGNLTVNGANPAAVWPTYRYAVWSSYDQWSGNWFAGNNAGMFGGVAPSTWTDSNGVASSMSADKNILRTLFNKSGKIYPNTTVWAETWYPYSSTNGKMAAALFRVKNTTQSDVTWTPSYYYTSYSGTGEMASVAVNGANAWQSNNNCGAQCNASPNLTIPKNRTSTVIFVVGSSPDSGSRSTFLAFFNNSLTLPSGLQFVDDLDTAAGGWEQ